MAKVYRDEGDDERAFQLYMRYITLAVQNIPKHPEYKTAESVEKQQARQQCKEIFPVIEELKLNLKKRYEAQYRFHLEELEARREEEERQRLAEQRMRESQEQTDNLDNFEELNVDEEKLAMRLKQAKDRYAAYVASSESRSSPSEQLQVNLPPSPTAPPSYASITASNQNVSRPSIDRSTKSLAAPTFEVNKNFDGLRKIIVPSNLMESFLSRVQSNTVQNVETCGILAGKLSQNCFSISHLLIPKQRGTSDLCQTECEEDIFDFQDEHDLMTLGWIHTHPSQNAFMSSIDLHTHCSYQLMLSEAIAIVCAPKFDEVGLYSLTKNYGLQFIANCRLTGFHPHPQNPPLYQDCEHVQFDRSNSVKVVDLR